MSASRLEIARKISAGNITPVKSVISPSNRQPSVMVNINIYFKFIFYCLSILEKSDDRETKQKGLKS